MSSEDGDGRPSEFLAADLQITDVLTLFDTPFKKRRIPPDVTIDLSFARVSVRSGSAGAHGVAYAERTGGRHLDGSGVRFPCTPETGC